MRLVIVSDTHGNSIDPPPGDLLVHCGDLTGRGTPSELEGVEREFRRIEGRFTHGILFVAGNHDFLFEQDPARARSIVGTGTYLNESAATIGGVTFWGSPWTPQFFEWAFMAEDEQLAARWDLIPRDTDVLITHGPPYGVLDKTYRGALAGSPTLRHAVEAVKPTLHCFGHIHEAYGEEQIGGTHFINAAICNRANEVVNAAVVVELSPKR